MLAPDNQHARLELEGHTWQLRDIEFEGTATVSRFECLDCGAVRYE